MILALLILCVVVLVCFGLVVMFGAPYVPSLKPHVAAALDLLDLKKGDLLLELGAGDGRVMVAALERGQRVIGYEINPILALIAWLRVRRYGKRAKVVWGDAFRAQWPDDARAVYLFGVQRLAGKVHQRLSTWSGIKFATVGFQVPGKTAAATRDAVYVYEY